MRAKAIGPAAGISMVRLLYSGRGSVSLYAAAHGDERPRGMEISWSGIALKKSTRR